jgi:hypothetical protein
MLRLALKTPKTTVKAIYLLFTFVLLGSVAIPKQGGTQSLTGNITIKEGGHIWIEGTAGPVDFSCHAEKLSGHGKIENEQKPTTSVTGNGEINISVSLPVKSLNCGKRAMNNDMYGALKAEKFPFIHYRLLEASLTEGGSNTPIDGEQNWLNIRTRGIMEIAGVQDTTTVHVRGKVLGNNEFRVKGSKLIHMDTYSIDPPSKMFGLIRANKELTVYFDVAVALNNEAIK